MPSFGNLMWIVQVVFWGVVLVVVLILGWRNREKILESLRKFLEELKAFWARLFGLKRAKKTNPSDTDSETKPLRRPPVPFSRFSDPFRNGQSEQMSLTRLVRYSFDALEAWARERGIERLEDQTPHEFVLELVALDRNLARKARQVADFYCTIAFAREQLDESAVRMELQKFWSELHAPIPELPDSVQTA